MTTTPMRATTTLRRRFSAAPPAHLIPSDLATLAAELASTHAERTRAEVEQARLMDNQLTYKAERYDLEFLGDEARAGRTPKSATPNADKLAHDRLEIAAQVVRATALHESVQREMDRHIVQHGAEVVTHTAELVDSARAAYLDAVAAMEVARTTYYEAVETDRWARAGHEGMSTHISYNRPRVDDFPLEALRKELVKVQRSRTRVTGF